MLLPHGSFIRYLSDNFGTQNLANISGKHIAGYVEERQAEGKSASTIALDLCVIRYSHDQMGGSNTRHRIPNNT
ncbi:site-specific integrase [Paenibacillus sp. OAE614]|uniref:site-specific integrase n=1 Tax=Paenibacillus sp. OAE614 TaxID=2663804 RepID=UPI00178B037B